MAAGCQVTIADCFDCNVDIERTLVIPALDELVFTRELYSIVSIVIEQLLLLYSVPSEEGRGSVTESANGRHAYANIEGSFG